MGQIQHHQDAGTSELLSTKLTPPRLRAALVPRAFLLARLDEGLAHKLTLISAPAGSGKTTLVSQWLHHFRLPISDFGLDSTEASEIQNPQFAWLSLDAGDNDPVRFWRYVLTAGQTLETSVGRSALALLRTSQQPPFEAMLTTFINELAQLSGRYILVLEDYHAITSPQVHETMTFLLDHLPPTLHLIMLTRSDPPLPLARLRARNDIVELRASDLRFSLEEIQAFFQQTLHLPLSVEVISRLEARAEGWVAGLQLVALALQGRHDAQAVEQFLATFAGSHGRILEYLVEEVLRVQPAPFQEFLLETTFLNRLTGALCDAVTGRSDSASLLEQLERANLFLSPLDGAQQWYRYHALFAEAMQHYARRRLGETGLRALYEQASLWYEQHGFLADAVETALSAQDFSRAAGLIERAVTSQPVVNNEYHTQRRWLEQLPEETLRTHPTLSFTYAVAILFTSDQRAPATMARLQGPLEQAEQRWRAEGNRPNLGRALGFRALATWWQGAFPQAFAAARQALALLAEEDRFWRGLSLLGVGAEAGLAGQLKVAQQTLLEARAQLEAVGDSYTMLSATYTLGEVCARQGELHQAAQFYRQVLAGITEAAPRTIVHWADFDRGRALVGLAALNLEWNELETAEQELSQALDLGRRLPDEELQVHSSLLLARVLHVRGETAQAQELLHRLIAQTSPRWPLLLREAHAGQAWLSLAVGDLTAVQHWETTWAQPDDAVPLVQQEQEQLIVTRLRIAQGQAEVALHLLERWQAEAQAQGRGRSTLEILILTALAHFSQQQLPQARQTLREALAQPEGYRRLFLDEGAPMAALLQALLPEVKETPLGAYVQSLLLAFAKDEGGRMKDETKSFHPSSFIPHPLIEPLSDRELEVLRWLNTELSGPEIAAELLVSVNTLKTHLKHIYGKLNARSRYEAVERAKQLNLL
jgi:LuxR family maltose regulon positive regulatory protein